MRARSALRLSAASAALALVLSALALGVRVTPAQALPPIGAVTSGNADSYATDITPDGRFVLFSSLASNIALPSTGHINAFLRDRATGVTSVLTNANANVNAIGVSNEGRYVTYETAATNFVPSGRPNVYQLDRTTGTTRRLINDAGDSDQSTVSPDGRFVAFRHATSVGGTKDIRVWDRTTGASVGVTAGNADSSTPFVSDDGRYVTFSSTATNLVNPAPSNHENVYQWDRTTGVTTIITSGNDDSGPESVSADGRFVEITSRATDLVPGTTGFYNIYVWDRSTHTLQRYTNGDNPSYTASISDDGRYVYFISQASNLSPAAVNFNLKVFVVDRSGNGIPALISPGNVNSRVGEATPDGHFVTYRSDGAHGGVFLKSANPAEQPLRLTDSAQNSTSPVVSSSGGVVAFSSGDNNLVSPAVSAYWNVFVSDLNGVPSQKFVRAAYTDFLNRAPTTNEISLQTAALQGGKTRAALVKELANSPEWVSAIVNKLYLNTLGRVGDAGGVNYWTNEIRSRRRTVANVAANFYASDEYFAHIGGGTNDTWVADLYVKLLHRQADAGGKAYWSQQATLNGRFSVTSRFYASAESVSTRVNDLYIALLGRNGDPGGIAYWGGRILTEGDIALAVNLASSDEYFARAQNRFA